MRYCHPLPGRWEEGNTWQENFDLEGVATPAIMGSTMDYLTIGAGPDQWWESCQLVMRERKHFLFGWRICGFWWWWERASYQWQCPRLGWWWERVSCQWQCPRPLSYWGLRWEEGNTSIFVWREFGFGWWWERVRCQWQCPRPLSYWGL